MIKKALNKRMLPLKDTIPLSTNQESASFRTVGPFDDSTVTYTGKKFTDVLDTTKHVRIIPGYYGKSRLTRY